MTAVVDSQQLTGRAVAFLIADGVSLIELEEPHRMLEAAGARVELVAPHYGEVLAMDYLEKAGTVPVDRALLDADPTRYDALVLPGGVANADHLRRDPDAVAFVAAFPAQARSVAAICHAPWLLVEAGMVRGRTLTSWPSLKTDIRNAGGVWVDEPVHVDGRFITSRGPRDLAAFCGALTAALLDTRARNDRPAGR
jgi:protease I